MKTRREIAASLGMRENANWPQVDNRLLRERMVGGDDLLDALELVHRLNTALKKRGLAGQDESQAALDELLALKELMVRIARERA